jgi:DNA-binding MarR family transcriptional regulator
MDENSFVFKIARIRKALRREFDARAEGIGITAAQLPVLYRLWKEEGILISVLTRDIASDGGTVTGLLDRLEAKELIRRERSHDDRRAIRIFLTPAGRELQGGVMQILGALNQQALEGFSLPERSQIAQALERVEGNLGMGDRF